VDTVLIILSAVMCLSGGWMLVKATTSSSEDLSKSIPQEIADGRGMELRSLDALDDERHVRQVDLRGSNHVIYFFATTCRFCELQRKFIANVLSQLDSSAVITASEEPLGMTRSYWQVTGARLANPVSLKPGSLRKFGIGGTPALLFVSADGRIKSVYLGAAMGWPLERFRKELGGVAVAMSKVKS
jgi:hypothetical protein